jgi:cytochrome c
VTALARRSGWTTALAACIISTFTTVAAAQDSSAVKPDSMRSTQLGVYTDVQAKRGQQVYAGTCSSCHQPTSHQGAAFTQNWDQHPLVDLFNYVSTQMPQDNPGSLAPNDAADVVAFLLKIYAMPAGTTELAPDTVAMKKILIDSRTTRPPQ